MTPAEGSRRFFQGAISVWLGAPDFKGLGFDMSLSEHFDLSLRRYLPVIARRRNAFDYIELLNEKVELAFRQYSDGEVDLARKTMVALLDLIYDHLHLPSERELQALAEDANKNVAARLPKRVNRRDGNA
ncbi:hypothetical protein [Piscinibacter sp. XHJ-5]|uniref:hypothetical protein n=1 Tax=Piscinibacter sp. XHJ-5 TaxID=3037797 RepID=UPI002452F49F|nr:hypothetical protein [Piscinibacter sp. XHJ-5]